MEKLIRLLSSGMSQLRVGGSSISFRLLLRNADLLIVPWVLDILVLYSYICARAASSAIPAATTYLGYQVRPQLLALVYSGHQTLFQAAAARVNLGYLMVCGAVALLILSLESHISKLVGADSGDFRQVLIWAVAGQSTPVLFGATSLLMQVNDRRVFHDLLLGVAVVFFLCFVAVIDDWDTILIVQTWAVAQLTHAGICALLLTQCGVWPGLTAVFHKEIKLF
ncbi:hypothetical protein [uncultured Sulfitobacter sp.]|uniref:hypothetical protein n=1 Tax=uncultured Sulfitobacter sp. TaxID=191468 RepID=UPI00261E1719|nr:hypothetical protein [uncultured Sulfitobacter sp.]